jgi:hypothetical protein
MCLPAAWPATSRNTPQTTPVGCFRHPRFLAVTGPTAATSAQLVEERCTWDRGAVVLVVVACSSARPPCPIPSYPRAAAVYFCPSPRRPVAQSHHRLAADAHSLTLEGGVHQHYPCHFMRISRSKVPYHGSTVRVPYEHKRALLTELGESVSQFEIHL